jgi:LPXTG-motif cell wall-anchored protein
MNKAIAAAITMMAAGAVSVSAMSGTVSAAEDCLSETYSWNNPTVSQLATWQPTLSTGLSIPAPAAGEHIAVIATGWSSFDRLMEENPELTREIQNEIAEQFSVRVGGVQVGGLSADLPDNAAQGAPTPWFSGVLSGTFGGVDTDVPGGAITLHHSGNTSSFNSFTPKTVTITVVRCKPPTTTAAPTTTVARPTTTVVTPTTTPTTTPAPTTTAVGSGGPTTTVAGGSVTTVPGGSLPATGGDMTLPLILAGLAAGTGAALLMVRRKAGTH